MTGQAVPLAGELIARAHAAAAKAQWLETLDLAAQALAADPAHAEAAVLVGTARQRLGTVSAAGAQLRQLTVLAVDMTGSTAIAARLGPERTRALMLGLYELCAEVVSRYEGRIAHYGGDGVLAQFGHPIAHEDDARRAVLAGIELLDRIERREHNWTALAGEPVTVRLGVDSGIAAVGPTGPRPWSPDELAGEPPTVASRVQATAEPMTIRVTDATNRLIAGWFETLRVGSLALEGHAQPVGLHLVLAQTEAETRLEARVATRPSLVNRSQELAVLRAAWNDVAAGGRRRSVMICGEAGIGKSRLAEHTLATAAASGAARIGLTCSAMFRDSPLRPVARALARYLRVFPHEGGTDELWLEATRRRLRQLPGGTLPIEEVVPILGWLLGIGSHPPVIDLDPEELRRRAFGVLVDVFEALGGDAMLVVSVEDADNADPSTLALLARLLERDASPMLMVITAREPVPVLEADHTLELTGLNEDNVAALVRSVGPELPGGVVRSIVDRCDGVPFFAEELARAASESGGDEVAQPTELSAFLAARLDELGTALRELVDQISVAGTAVRLDVLARLTGLEPDELDRLIADLSRRRMMIRTSGDTSDTVRFVHALQRDVAYGQLLAARRAELHGRLASILSELPPGVVAPEDLAAHCALAGERAGAAAHWLEAGTRAAALGAHREALELFRHALAALEPLPAAPERSALELGAQLGVGNAVSTIAGYTAPESRAAFERAVALAEELGDAVATFPAVWGTWTYWFVLGEHTVAGELSARCMRIGSEQRDDPRFRLAAAAITGYERLYLGDFAGACEELALARHVGVEPLPAFPHDPGIVSGAALSVALLLAGDRDASRSVAAEVSERSDALVPGERRTSLTQAWTGCKLAWRAQLDDQPETAIAFAEEAGAIADSHGHSVWLAAATMHRAIALCSLGRLDEGLPVLQAVFDGWRAAGRDRAGTQLHPVLMSPYFGGRLAEALLTAGERARSRALAAQLLAEIERSGERQWELQLRALA